MVHFRQHKFWSAWTALLLGGTITLIIAANVQSSAEKSETRDFAFACSDIKGKIIARISLQKQLLQSGVGLFESSDDVTRKEWGYFAQSLDIDNEVPGVQGIGFAALIPKDSLGAHMQAVQKEGFPTYRVHPEGLRDRYSSVIYIEPFSGRNLRAFGYDMLSEPVRRAAMERACDSHVITLSGKVRLVQETDRDLQAGVLMYAPVYRKDMPKVTLAERRAALIGWVYSPYRMTNLMKEILGDWGKNERLNLRLKLYDEQLSEDALLYDSSPGSSSGDTREYVVIPIDMFGRKWMLSFTQTHNEAEMSQMWMVIIFGSIISFLVFALIRSSLKMRNQAMQIAQKLTEELQESEQRLQNVIIGTNVGTWEWNIQTDEVVFNERWAEIIGYNLEELQPISFDTWVQLVHPDDLQESERQLEMHFRREIDYYSIDVRMKHKDGHWVWILDRGKVTEWDRGGHPIRMSGTHTDITERKIAEEKLRESEERLRVILNTLTEGVALNEMIFNDQGEMIDYRILEVNKAFYTIADFRKEDNVIGEFASKIYGMSTEVMKEFWRDHTDVTENVILEIVSPISQRIFLISTSPFKDGRFVTSFSDITARRQAQKKLADSEARLRAIIQSEPECIKIIDADGNLEEMNAAGLALLQVDSIEQIRGLHIRHALAPESLDAYMELHKRVLEGESARLEFEIIGLKGKRSWVETHAVPITENGQIKELSVTRDITERKMQEQALRESEQKLKAAEAIAQIGNFEVDIHTQMMHLSEEMLKILGESPRSTPFTAQEIAGFIHPDERESVMESVRHSMNLGENITLIIRIQRKNGEERYLHNVTNIILDANHKPLKLFGIAQDITESKRQQDSLRAALVEKEILLRELHHRVKNNLASIISLVDLQKKTMRDKIHHSGLDELAQRIKSMSLVHEHLYHSQKLSHINFKDYVTTLASSLRASFALGRQVLFTIDTDVAVGLDIAIPCGMIVNELLTNSLKYAFPEGISRGETTPEITIMMKRTGDDYLLRVADNGVGLKAEYDWENASTLGQRLVRMLGQHQLGADINVDCSQGTAYEFRFTFKEKMKELTP
ncbi:MAG: CHASE domain-containing protein [Candidatus Kapaibacterium sp.]